jgi:hypothetical protein
MKKSGKQSLHQPTSDRFRECVFPGSVPKAFWLFPFLTLNPSFKALRRFNRMANHTSGSIAYFPTLVNPYFSVFSAHFRHFSALPRAGLNIPHRIGIIIGAQVIDYRVTTMINTEGPEHETKDIHYTVYRIHPCSRLFRL